MLEALEGVGQEKPKRHGKHKGRVIHGLLRVVACGGLFCFEWLMGDGE